MVELMFGDGGGDVWGWWRWCLGMVEVMFGDDGGDAWWWCRWCFVMVEMMFGDGGDDVWWWWRWCLVMVEVMFDGGGDVWWWWGWCFVMVQSQCCWLRQIVVSTFKDPSVCLNFKPFLLQSMVHSIPLWSFINYRKSSRYSVTSHKLIKHVTACPVLHEFDPPP